MTILDILKENRASYAKRIIKTKKLKPPLNDPFSFSEISNPYVFHLRMHRPTVLVFRREDLKNLVKIDYNEADRYGQLDSIHHGGSPGKMSYKHEHEWYTWDSPTYPGLIGITLNKTVVKISEADVSDDRFHGTILFGIPTEYIPINELKESDLTFDLDYSNVPSYDKNNRVY